MDDFDEYVESEELYNAVECREILSMIDLQIDDPMDSSINYFKRLKKELAKEDDKVVNKIYFDIFKSIIDKFKIEISTEELQDIEESPEDATKIFYNFFVRDAKKNAKLYLRNYLRDNKVRKSLVSNYKVGGSYVKSSYGSKANFILINRMPSLIDDIKDFEDSLKKFIKVVAETNESKETIFLMNLIDLDSISSGTFSKKTIKRLKDADDFSKICNDLVCDMNDTVVGPQLKAAGLGTYISLFSKPEDIAEEDESSDDEDEN